MRIAKVVVAIAATVLGAPMLRAQSSFKKDIPDSLVKRAKITESVASATAQARLPKGVIEAVELEKENGKLLYSYDIRTAGKSGIDEVQVDALTGKIVSVSHESPADEKKEAAEDAKAAAKAKTKKPEAL